MNPFPLVFDCLKRRKRKNPKANDHKKKEIVFYKQESKNDNGITKVTFRAEFKFESSVNQIWHFRHLDLYSFELLHGLHCISGIVPDKLKTAIEINQENLKSYKDDGSFLIHLVEDLLDQFIKIDRQNNQRQLDTHCIETLFVPIVSGNLPVSTNLIKVCHSQVLEDYKALFITFRNILPTRNLPLLNLLSSHIEKVTTDLNNCYLEYESNIRLQLLQWTRQYR